RRALTPPAPQPRRSQISCSPGDVCLIALVSASRVVAPGQLNAGDSEPMTLSTGPWPASSALRPWQADALAAYQGNEAESFLCASTPGAGKTTFGLRIAH